MTCPRTVYEQISQLAIKVNVLDGKNRGLVGWVIGVSVGTLRVLDVETETEVNSLYS